MKDRVGQTQACVLLTITMALSSCYAAEPLTVEEEGLARVVIAGESSRTARRLAAADKLAAQGKETEAALEYQRILSDAADELVPISARHSLQARRLCYLRLVALPNAALRAYRSRVDVQAKKWLEVGKANRDSDLLRRVVNDLFCSQYTDQALDLLGDLAFEQGHFEEAERWWRMVALPASEQGQPSQRTDELLFPDPQVDLARIRAKEILARLFRGEAHDLEFELKSFQSFHPKAEGHLAGDNGNYAQILRGWLSQPDRLAPFSFEDSWLTFAGHATRNRVLPQAADNFLRFVRFGRPHWAVDLATGNRIPLENGSRVGDRGDPVPDEWRRFAFHPLILDDRVFVADVHSVTAHHLFTGEKVLQYDLFTDAEDEDASLTLRLPANPDLSYTLTASEDRIYACLGGPSLGLPKQAGNHLVCLNRQPIPSGGVKRWRVQARAPDGTRAVFEGAPIAYLSQVFVTVARSREALAQIGIACYDADTGALRWQQDICETRERGSSEKRLRQHLLTLAGACLVYCSHSGAIVALDAATGRRLWAVRYLSRGAKTEDGIPSPRGLTPCLYAGRRLFVAPLDLDRILCLDAETGHLLWESGPLELVHLLGLAKGRLIFTAVTFSSYTPQHCIRAIDAATGNALPNWFQPSDGLDEMRTMGRGFLAGDCVFWPTSSGMHILNIEDGAIVRSISNLRGNLAAARGCLVAAGTRELSAYLPENALPASDFAPARDGVDGKR